jgi:beta-N-acetylhexosaminidase
LEFEKSATVPATLSPAILTGLLRNELKFTGLVVTDSLGMGGVVAHFAPGDAAVRAIKAGADILLSPPDVDESIRAVLEAVRHGEIAEDRINASVERILTAKARLGLAAERFTDISLIGNVVSSRQSLNVVQTVAEKSLTLVRDERGLIPLKNDLSKGVFHIAITDKDTNPEERAGIGREMTSELRRRGFRTDAVVIESGTTSDDVQRMLQRAETYDVVMVSLFVRPRSGRGSIGLPEADAQALKGLLEKQLPVIVISFGSPYFLLDFPKITTYLCAFGDYVDSVPSQRAVARALVGEIPITGKLPVTLPGLYPRGHALPVGARETR